MEQDKKSSSSTLNTYVIILLGIQVLLLGFILYKTTILETKLTGIAAGAKTGMQTKKVKDVSFGSLQALGKPGSAVQIVIFSDYQCPYCSKAFLILDELIANNPDQIQIHVRNFPLDGHPLAKPAAIAAICANEQGRFWEYHNLLFKNQEQLSIEGFAKFAQDLNLNEELFNRCQSSEFPVHIIEDDIAAAEKYNITGTPALIINNELIFGADEETIKTIVETGINN